MSYVKSSLIPGEKVVAWARHHWIMHVAALFRLCIAVGIGAVIALLRPELGRWLSGVVDGLDAANAELVWLGLGGLIAAGGVLRYIGFLVWIWSAEYAVTTRRVVMKNGLIRRRTFEVMLAQIETVGVHQGLRGRVLGYGALSLTATGGSRGSWRAIAEPLWFKKKVEMTMQEGPRTGGAAGVRGGARAGGAGDAAAAPAAPDGPGRFRVVGVRRDTGEDAEMMVEAKSGANAKVKGELAGVVVTEVVRV